MLVGFIGFIFAVLGIYGFYTANIVLLYLGMSFTILEHIIGIISGQQKGLGTVWLALFICLILIINGVNWLQSIAICLCFENVISFVLGLILLLIVGKIQNEEKEEDVLEKKKK